jgi:hypothetical protein
MRIAAGCLRLIAGWPLRSVSSEQSASSAKGEEFIKKLWKTDILGLSYFIELAMLCGSFGVGQCGRANQ